MFSNQFDGLGDGRQHFSDGWNLDLKASAIMAFPDTCSKPRDDEDGIKCIDGLEERVHFPLC